MYDAYKKVIRDTMKQVRAKASVTYRTKASKLICNRIRTLESYRYAKHLALYYAVHGEIDLSPLWNSAPLHGKSCYFPVINEDFTLSFLPATPITPFKTNQYGIAEPDVSKELAIPIEKLDLILIPVVAFDVHCTRIGMGGGYYDRTLANQNRPDFYGVAYQFQKIDYINPDPWDISLDKIITQKAIYSRS